MKMTEFYEKYWRIKLPSGEIIKPKLTNNEKLIFDKADELGVAAYVKTGGRRCGFKYIVHPLIEEALKT